jgi:hypothetical protein
MLVYLDSAHFYYLERASTAAVAHFQAVWAEAGCELGLSLHHLQEMAQLGDENSIERRLKTIDLFPLVRCLPASSEVVLRFEVQIQIMRCLGYEVDPRRIAVSTLFPVRPFREVAEALAINGPILRKMREPLQIAANASNLTKGQKKLSLRRGIPPDEAARLTARELALEALEGHPPELSELLLELFERVEAEVARAGTVRAALEMMYELDHVAVRSAIPDTDLPMMSVFFRTARNEADNVGGRLEIERDKVLEVVDDIDPYLCPGFALQLAARRARESHTKPDEASDEIDLAHLAFAPYVDLLLADKRTHAFVQQEARKPQGGLRPEFIENIVRVGSLTQLEEHIRKRAGAV